MNETKSIQVPADLHKRILELRKVAKDKMNLDSGVNVNLAGVISVAIGILENEWNLQK